MVVKCTQDCILIRYRKMTDMETTAFERMYCLHFPRGGVNHAMQGPVRKNQGRSGDRKKPGPKTLLCFSWGRNGRGKVRSLGLFSLSTFSRLQGSGGTPGCLVLGPGWFRAEGYPLGVWELSRGGVGCSGSEWFGLQMKGWLAGKLFTISEN